MGSLWAGLYGQKMNKETDDINLVVESLPSLYKALASVPSTEMRGGGRKKHGQVPSVGWMDSGNLGGFWGAVMLLLWHQTGVGAMEEKNPKFWGW